MDLNNKSNLNVDRPIWPRAAVAWIIWSMKALEDFESKTYDYTRDNPIFVTNYIDPRGHQCVWKMDYKHKVLQRQIRMQKKLSEEIKIILHPTGKTSSRLDNKSDHKWDHEGSLMWTLFRIQVTG